MPAAESCCTVSVDHSTLSPDFRNMQQTSRDKTDRLLRAAAEFTINAFDGLGLRCHWPARPAP
jgi:hypothetical protein